LDIISAFCIGWASYPKASIMEGKSKIESLKSTPEEVAILGGGISGKAAQKLVCSRGKASSVFSEDERIFDQSAAESCSFVVQSPGFSPMHPWVKVAKDANKICISELDLAFAYGSFSEMVAVTGTNGKTSLTGILNHIANQLQIPALSLGNIGIPLSDAVTRGADKDRLIFHETSSFQAITSKFFKPDSVIWINFSPDHLDYHGSIKDYFCAKLKLIQSCVNPERVFLGPSVLKFAKEHSIPINPFFHEVQLLGKAEIPPQINAFHLSHPQVENLGFALAWFLQRGISRSEFFAALEGYQPEPYRLQKVSDINGVKFWNDAKSTNLGSVLSACKSFAKKIIWIGGGKNKGQGLDDFSTAIFPYLEKAFVIGQTGGELCKHLVSKGVQTEICLTLRDAVCRAYQSAQGVSHILFSPGFASFDMFKDYSDRGNSFTSIVFDLKSAAQATTKLT